MFSGWREPCSRHFLMIWCPFACLTCSTCLQPWPVRAVHIKISPPLPPLTPNAARHENMTLLRIIHVLEPTRPQREHTRAHQTALIDLKNVILWRAIEYNGETMYDIVELPQYFYNLVTSVVVIANTSVRLSWKLFTCIIEDNVYWIKVSQIIYTLFLKLNHRQILYNPATCLTTNLSDQTPILFAK